MRRSASVISASPGRGGFCSAAFAICSSTDLLSHPRAISSFYERLQESVPRCHASNGLCSTHQRKFPPMRVCQVASFGIDSLELVDRPTSQPGPGETLVKIHAVSLNYRDLMMVKGLYNPKLKLPRIPCSDGAGEVAAVGEGVSAWKPGDRVCGIFMQNWLDGPPTTAKLQGALGGAIDGDLSAYDP